MSSHRYWDFKSGEFYKLFRHMVSNTFEFYGRASQKEYLVYLISWITYSVLSYSVFWIILRFKLAQIVDGVATSGVGAIDSILRSFEILNFLLVPLSGLFVLFSFCIMVMSLSVSIRRLHDFGCSGWWFILIIIGLSMVSVFVFMLLAKFQDFFVQYGLGLFSFLLGQAVNYGLTGFIMLRKDSDGMNAYGEPPLL